jgi:hypothetical protein
LNTKTVMFGFRERLQNVKHSFGPSCAQPEIGKRESRTTHTRALFAESECEFVVFTSSKSMSYVRTWSLVNIMFKK